MFHKILYIKYIPLPGSPSLSLTTRVPSTETTIQTNKKWLLLHILPNLLHNSMNSSLLQMGRQGLRLTLYLPINAEKESDIFIFTSFLQKGETEGNHKSHHVLISVSIWAYCLTLHPNFCLPQWEGRHDFQSWIITKLWNLPTLGRQKEKMPKC